MVTGAQQYIGIVVGRGRLDFGLFDVPEGTVIQFLIPDAGTAYVAVAVAVIGAIVTFIVGGEAKRFEGVPEGEKIAQRQKMIAEVEKKYGEQ